MYSSSQTAHLTLVLSTLSLSTLSFNTKVSGAIYNITCAVCEEDYIEETARPFITRWKEHIKGKTSAVHQHCMKTGHHIDLEHAKILETEDNTTKRCVKESIRIRRNKPNKY